MHTDEEKIERGKEIQKKAHKFTKILKTHTGEDQEWAREALYKLWDTCLEHTWVWHNTNPYCEVCKCKYCDADSPRTR